MSDWSWGYLLGMPFSLRIPFREAAAGPRKKGTSCKASEIEQHRLERLLIGWHHHLRNRNQQHGRRRTIGPNPTAPAKLETLTRWKDYRWGQEERHRAALPRMQTGHPRIRNEQTSQDLPQPKKKDPARIGTSGIRGGHPRKSWVSFHKTTGHLRNGLEQNHARIVGCRRGIARNFRWTGPKPNQNYRIHRHAALPAKKAEGITGKKQ